eukprot:949990-Pleurochrysis_carterae.AAC.1
MVHESLKTIASRMQREQVVNQATAAYNAANAAANANADTGTPAGIDNTGGPTTRSRNAMAAPAAPVALTPVVSSVSSVIDLLSDRASEAAAHQFVSECGAAPVAAKKHRGQQLQGVVAGKPQHAACLFGI